MEQERMRLLGEKQAIEMKLKKDWKQIGQNALNDWYDKRSTQIEQKRKVNKESEWAFLQLREEHKHSKNPWEKIIDNCEMNKSKYSGTKDVTWLRQAMIARKGDLGRLQTE